MKEWRELLRHWHPDKNPHRTEAREQRRLSQPSFRVLCFAGGHGSLPVLAEGKANARGRLAEYSGTGDRQLQGASGSNEAAKQPRKPPQWLGVIRAHGLQYSEALCETARQPWA